VKQTTDIYNANKWAPSEKKNTWSQVFKKPVARSSEMRSCTFISLRFPLFNLLTHISFLPKDAQMFFGVHQGASDFVKIRPDSVLSWISWESDMDSQMGNVCPLVCIWDVEEWNALKIHPRFSADHIQNCCPRSGLSGWFNNHVGWKHAHHEWEQWLPGVRLWMVKT
jgi:hypothetical protein